MRPFRALDLTLVFSVTTAFTAERPPALILVVDGMLAGESTRGMLFPPERSGTLTVVGPEHPWMQHVLDADRMARFVSALEPLLREHSIIDLEGIPDSAETIHYVKLQGAFDGKPFRADFSFMSSGFEGADARAFAKLVEVLVETAGAAWLAIAQPLIGGPRA